MRIDRLVIGILFSLIVSACGAGDTRPTPTLEVYRPPTQDPAVVQLQATEAARLTQQSLPTPTPACANGLRFVEDVTIEDGTVVAPGAQLDKRWRVENAGSCNWQKGYEVRLVAGPALEASTPQALYPALSSTEVVIRMTFIAPAEPGSYRSAWQAFDPDGAPFGDPFFIDIQVAVEE